MIPWELAVGLIAAAFFLASFAGYAAGREEERNNPRRRVGRPE